MGSRSPLHRLGWATAITVLLAACSSAPPTVTFDGDCGGLDGPAAIMMIEPASGALIWQRTVGDADGVAMSGDIVAAAGFSGGAMGLDLSSGEVRWCHDLGSPPDAGDLTLPGFAAADGVVATTTQRATVVAFEASTGTELWQESLTGAEGARVTTGTHGVFEVWTGSAEPQEPRLLDPRTGADVDTVAAELGSPGMEVRSAGGTDSQRVSIQVHDRDRIAWEQTVPGFDAYLLDSIVVVIDQTGGTGEFRGRAPDTLITAYDAMTGDQRWSTPVPRAAPIAARVGDLAVVSSGTEIVALDAQTGDITWRVDHGSPGRSGGFSELGGYRSFAATDDGRLVGVIVADFPYRD